MALCAHEKLCKIRTVWTVYSLWTDAITGDHHDDYQGYIFKFQFLQGTHKQRCFGIQLVGIHLYKNVSLEA